MLKEITKNVYFGPAGWSYKDWEGIVYPNDKKIDQLEFLARYFNTIEINSSFYRIPEQKITNSWLERVSFNKNFKFCAKLHQDFTHKKEYTKENVSFYRSAFSKMLEKEKLGTLLFQFPWSFKNCQENFSYLQRLFNNFSDFPITLEVRHNSWNKPDFYDFLIQAKIGFCNIDQPLFSHSLAPSNIKTTKVGYIRLHGKNYENWFNDNAGQNERYNYLYQETELQTWVDKIKDLSGKVEDLFVIANNHFKGQAVVNTFQLMSMCENNSKLSMPSTLVDHYPQLKSIAK